MNANEDRNETLYLKIIDITIGFALMIVIGISVLQNFMPGF